MMEVRALTFIIVGKKHHISIFPKNPRDGDRNGNVTAGTIVDTTITNPLTFDWYMQPVSPAFLSVHKEGGLKHFLFFHAARGPTRNRKTRSPHGPRRRFKVQPGRPARADEQSVVLVRAMHARREHPGAVLLREPPVRSSRASPRGRRRRRRRERGFHVEWREGQDGEKIARRASSSCAGTFLPALRKCYGGTESSRTQRECDQS